MTQEKKKQLDKGSIKAFVQGCAFARCLSPACPHFIGPHGAYDQMRLQPDEGIANALRLLGEGGLKLACVRSKVDLPEKLKKFQPIIDFSFTEVLNAEKDAFEEFAKNFKQASEELLKLGDQDKKSLVLIFYHSTRHELEGLQLLQTIKDEPNLEAALIQFLPMLHFCFDVESFWNLKEFSGLFLKMDFDSSISHSFTKKKSSVLSVPKLLAKTVENLQNMLAALILENPNFTANPSTNSNLKIVCNAISFFENINRLYPRDFEVPQADFINDAVRSETNLKIQLLILLQGALPRRMEKEIAKLEKLNPKIKEFNFLNYPCLFSKEHKVEILKLESFIAQDTEIESSLFSQPLSIFNMISQDHIYLELILRRDQLLEDSLNQLSSKSNASKLKKPLRVRFVGEPGVDEGGLTKEFFHLLISQLFSPQFGMFEVKNTRVWWFDHRSFECPLNYQLIGILLGLALYNQTILDLSFPLAVYKKLKLVSGSTAFADQLTIDDLAEIEPEIATSLKNTLKNNLKGKDSGLNFSVETDYFGEKRFYDLIKNGKDVPVTEENKEDFVEKYLDWFFNKSIQPQFEPFSKGFYSVMSGKVIKLFRADELDLAINGIESFNFQELKSTTKYDDGYTDDSITIKYFWEVLLNLNDNEKRDFLKFLTGSYKAPLKGLSEIKMVISRHGDNVNHLPSCHTCFNHLLLPDYKSKEKLQEKLLLALQYSEGFGLI